MTTAEEVADKDAAVCSAAYTSRLEDLLRREEQLTVDDYETLRKCLDHEIDFLSDGANWGCTRSLHTVCYLLSKQRNKRNIWKIWKAKCCNQDTYCSLDITWVYCHFESSQDFIDYVCTSPDCPDETQRIALSERLHDDLASWLRTNTFAQQNALVKTFKITASYLKYG